MGRAQGQVSACAITALVPVALQSWASADVACDSQVAGGLPEFLSRLLWGRDVPGTSWGLGVNISQHPSLSLSELCLGFQIRPAESMELLYMNYCYTIKIFLFPKSLFPRGTAVCALLLSTYPKEHLPNTPERTDTQNQFSWKRPEVIEFNL